MACTDTVRIDCKDADETLDYTNTWSTNLGADTIATSVWVASTGLTVVTGTNTTTTATVWVSGGTAGRWYDLKNTITTAGGRTLERTRRIKVEQR